MPKVPTATQKNGPRIFGPEIVERAARIIKTTRAKIDPNSFPVAEMVHFVSEADYAEAVMWAEALTLAHNPAISLDSGARRILEVVELENKTS